MFRLINEQQRQTDSIHEEKIALEKTEIRQIVLVSYKYKIYLFNKQKQHE